MNKTGIVFFLSLAAAVPPVMLMVPPGANAQSGGCQAGQVNLANGDSCLPPVALPPPPALPGNILGPSATDMSKALSPVPAKRPELPLCPAGQVLQGNGEPCIARTPATGQNQQ